MKNIINFFKKEMMFTVSLMAAIISLFITKPSVELLQSIDYKTLCILLMLLSVLDGFKHERLFDPFIKMAQKIHSIFFLSLFLIFAVFFSSAFVTNDVSLIIFVPLTIMLFKSGNKEKYILPVIVMQNIAAVRGSLLTPFGSPQNLYLFSKSGLDALSFMKMMFPLFIASLFLLILFIAFLYRKDLKEEIKHPEFKDEDYKGKKLLYSSLFVLVLLTIVTRTTLWPYITVFVMVMLFIFDRSVFKRVDYVLILTFLCFFVFSSSIAHNELIGGFLRKSVANNEYIWSIGISQIISNVPASIVLWPFTENLRALIYGLDSAGLITVIGSLASVINMRLYTNEYPGKSKDFMVAFMKISIIFFIIMQPYQLFLLSL